MDPALENLGWTEEQWNRICSTVTEEAQRARVAAQVLPTVQLENGASTVAIPGFRLNTRPEPYPFAPANQRLRVDSNPNLQLTTISVNVPLRSHEVADPDLQAALVMFRRAANYVARVEDALILDGRRGPNQRPRGLAGVAPVFRVTGDGAPPGIFIPPLPNKEVPPYFDAVGAPLPARPANGTDVFNQIVAAIVRLENNGSSGPFGCMLSHALFTQLCSPSVALVLPRDRILPFLQGPLVRSSQISSGGCVIALGGQPLEIVVASELSVRFLQTTTEPRQVFRVSERLALRIKEPQAIAIF